MQILHPNVAEHLDRLAASRDPVLREMEQHARRRGLPIVGPQVGTLLWQLALISRARRILELGSGFGYSASWFARGLAKGGRITCTDPSEENARAARRFFQRQGIEGRVRFEVGDALQVLDRLPGSFDIVFNDVNKEEYPRALPKILARLARGGILVTDNMLWEGRVVEDDGHASTRGVIRYTKMLYGSRDLVSTFLPIRDGVTVSVKLR